MIRRLLGSLTRTGSMDSARRLGGVQLVWADLPTHCKVKAGIGGVPLWNVFSTDIAESVFTLAGEFLLADGIVVVGCRVDHLVAVTHEAHELQFDICNLYFYA